MQEPVLSIRKLSKGYGQGDWVLNGIDLEVFPGQNKLKEHECSVLCLLLQRSLIQLDGIFQSVIQCIADQRMTDGGFL